MTDPGDRSIVVRCLGSFSLQLNGQPVERWRAGKARSLFQFLLMNREQVVLKERLYEALWPGADEASPTSLRVAVHGVRRILSAPFDEGTAPVRLTFEDVGYMLSTTDVWVDVDEFAAACTDGRIGTAHGDHEAAAAAYRRAVELYRGDFLAQNNSDWMEEFRQWNRTCLLKALAALRSHALRQGDTDAAAMWCRRTLDVDPYHEDSYRILIADHFTRGEPGQAKLWYELCRRRLNELGATPDRTTRMVFSRTLELGRERRLPGKLSTVPATARHPAHLQHQEPPTATSGSGASSRFRRHPDMGRKGPAFDPDRMRDTRSRSQYHRERPHE
jgi:two-component SAPR family response regulator